MAEEKLKSLPLLIEAREQLRKELVSEFSDNRDNGNWRFIGQALCDTDRAIEDLREIEK